MEKEKYIISVSLQNVSPLILWSFLGTANGLADWFADDVNINGKQFTFVWDKVPQVATQIHVRVGSFIRFRWDEDDSVTKYYFEFRISQSELTGETIMEVTDYAESGEKLDSIDLWYKQLSQLKRVLGVS